MRTHRWNLNNLFARAPPAPNSRPRNHVIHIPTRMCMHTSATAAMPSFACFDTKCARASTCLLW